jgi:hypothetical protein
VIGIGFGYNVAFVGAGVANWIFMCFYWAICGTSDPIATNKQTNRTLNDDTEALQADARPTLSSKSE